MNASTWANRVVERMRTASIGCVVVVNWGLRPQAIYQGSVSYGRVKEGHRRSILGYYTPNVRPSDLAADVQEHWV